MAFSLARFIQTLEKCNPQEEGDFYNEDGVLICGKCLTPRRKQIYDKKTETHYWAPIICECREEIEKQKDLDSHSANYLMRQKNSNMERKYYYANFKNFKVTSENKLNLVQCQTYVENWEDMKKQNQGLMFYGKNGTGKTYMAATIANEILKDRTQTVLIVPLLALVKQLQTQDFDAESQNTLDRIANVDLLILDDFGAERNSGYVLEHVFHIINTRYQSGKPLIITTNLDFDTIKNNQDSTKNRIYDRILELCVPVKVLGESFRKQSASENYNHFINLVNQTQNRKETKP